MSDLLIDQNSLIIIVLSCIILGFAWAYLINFLIKIYISLMARKKRDYKLLIDAKFWKDWESLRVHKRILKLRNKAAELSIKFKENEENDDYNNKNVLDAMALYTILQSMYDTLIKK